MPKQSAGLMMYRKREGHIETFLVHPGGPYWTQKVVIVDAGSAPAEIDRALTQMITPRRPVYIDNSDSDPYLLSSPLNRACANSRSTPGSSI
jgi:hypothetical protein